MPRSRAVLVAHGIPPPAARLPGRPRAERRLEYLADFAELHRSDPVACFGLGHAMGEEIGLDMPLDRRLANAPPAKKEEVGAERAIPFARLIGADLDAVRESVGTLEGGRAIMHRDV